MTHGRKKIQNNLMRKALAVLVCVTSLCLEAWDQELLPEDRGAVGLSQSLRKLTTTARVLYVAAHPDDEDAATITWLARAWGAHVVLVSLTRGEAGANLVSNDFFDRLGALRTAEFLRAAQYYGVAGVRFTRFIDFGYSKSLEETFRNWNREELLRDLVRIVREEQPHILISRFQGSLRDGHGNHQAAGVLAQQAFEAAADASRFPEQLSAGLKPWRAQKLYIGGWRENENWTLRVDSGVYDPLLGRTYAQLAREGYRQHRSQGAGAVIQPPGSVYSYYKLVASDGPIPSREEHFFDGLRLGVAISEYNEHLRRALQEFRADEAWRVAPHLARALQVVRAARLELNSKDQEIKERQLQQALAQAVGVQFSALVDPAEKPSGPLALFQAWQTLRYATPGQRFSVTCSFWALGAQLRGFEFLGDQAQVRPLGNNRFEVTIADVAKPTVAYWFRPDIRQNFYTLAEEKQFGQPLPPAPLRVRATYLVEGVEVAVEREVEITSLDSLGLQVRRPLAIAPPVSVHLNASSGYLPRAFTDYSLPVTVRNHFQGGVRGQLQIQAPDGWRAEPNVADFAMEKEGEEQRLVFHLKPPLKLREGNYRVHATATFSGRQYKESFIAVSQPELVPVFLSSPAVHTIRVVDVAVAPRLRVGYIPGTGDDVPEAMRQLGVEPEILDATQLATADLSRYHTLVLGIRAYAARKDLRTHNQRLLDYVFQGGVLVVQYNTQEYDNNYGPYPYSMTARAEEVSEEDSPVEILDPAHPVFQEPNRITLRDFDGWIEQRGSKFFTTWDARWKPLVSMHDTGQPPQRGIWLVARHGKGLYIYCALAWYRQLPFAVPGAARLFANLISLGAPTASWRARER
ncbi:MAG: PIG-L family deacetylase [Bryobacteraceae bacterium]|nr:PIG-L family deacetylase [Bryobacteraceae bacterium]MDW8377637.1 PIG-L family deacetylase [Bryobacterales bacterium]